MDSISNCNISSIGYCGVSDLPAKPQNFRNQPVQGVHFGPKTPADADPPAGLIPVQGLNDLPRGDSRPDHLGFQFFGYGVCCKEKLPLHRHHRRLHNGDELLAALVVSPDFTRAHRQRVAGLDRFSDGEELLARGGG